jgi:hypothetical protein
MVDFTPTHAQAKELAPRVRRGEAKAAIAKSLSKPPTLTTDGVIRGYAPRDATEEGADEGIEALH